jgi:Rrf2 family transcriptional regulator, cysteine metabolism repressor
MNFSAKTEYGVRLMVELGRQHGGPPTSLKAIAEAEGLPLSYLEHVAADLKRAGLVEATRGAHGGYQLTRAPGEIAMDGVVNALEGTIAPMECFVSLPTSRVACSHTADRGHACATKLLWTRVQGGVLKVLQGTTLAELVEFSQSHAPVAAA